MSGPAREYRSAGHVLTAHLEGEAVLLDMETKKYFRMNRTAAAIWKELERGRTRAALLDHLCAAFEVDRTEAGRELDRTLAELQERRLIVTSAAGKAEEPER